MTQAPSLEQVAAIMSLVSDTREGLFVLDDGKLRDLFTRARDTQAAAGNEEQARLLQYEVEAWSLMLHEQQVPDSEDVFVAMIGYADGTKWPDPERFDAQHLAHLEKKAESTYNPAIKSRYYDICWERQRDHRHGRAAVNAYFDTAEALSSSEESIEKWDLIQALSRSLVISLQLNDKHLIDDSIHRITTQLDLESTSENPRFVIELAEALVHRTTKYPDALQVAKNALKIGIRVFEQDHKPMLVQSAVDVLIKVLRRLQSPEQEIVDAQVKRLLSLIQEATASETHLGAAHFYQEALIYLRQLPRTVQRQWTDDLEKRLTEQIRLGDSEFSTFSTEIDIDTASLDKLLGILHSLKPAARYALLRNNQVLLVPNIDQIRRFEQETKDETPLLHLISHQPIQNERIADSSRSPEEILDSNVARTYQLHLNIYSHRLAYLIYHLRLKNRLPRRSFLSLLDQSDILAGLELRPLRHALTRYFALDYQSAVPLLILEAERVFRHIAEQIGEPITKTNTRGNDRKTGTSDYRNLDELLTLPLMESTLGVDNIYFLRYLLTERRGNSLRHETAHGALDPAICNALVANMLFYIYLWLTGFSKVTE